MFEPGNKHAAKNKVFDAALRRAIAQDEGLKVREAADKLLSSAAEGQPWALSMLADRLDGKAAQSVTISGDDENPLFIASADALRAKLRGETQ